MSVATIKRVEAACSAFAAHHRLPEPAAGDSLELAPERAAGTYGAIHPVVSIAGKAPVTAIVAKLFSTAELALGGGPQPILDSLADLRDALEQRGRAGWQDAVLALPYRFLAVQLDGRERFVALMLDLAARGYEAAPLIDLADLAEYRKQPLDARIAFAVSLAERAQVLTEVGFVHGDLNPENLLCNPHTGDVQVIDFDSGAVVSSGCERPRTCGKHDDCMPPDVKVPAAPGGVDVSLFTPGAERWSWASLIGLFLFAVHPGFFLDEISASSIAAYARAPESWPDIDATGPLFTTIDVNRRAYVQMLPVFRSIPAELAELFVRLFDAGVDGDARPAPAEWLTGLSGLRAPPTLEVKLLSDDCVLEGDDIVIAWRAGNATHVELAPGGRQPATGSITLVATAHVRVSVTAINAFGTDTVHAPLVRVMPLPRIDRIVLPEFPGFSVAGLSVARAAAPSRPAATAGPVPPRLVAVGPPASRVPRPARLSFPSPPRFPAQYSHRSPMRRRRRS